MNDNELTSPLIDSLLEQIHAENTAALEAFWREVMEKGAPLIEPVEGDSR